MSTSATNQRHDATRTVFPWRNDGATTCPPYGLFEITDYEVTSNGRIIIVGKRCEDTGKPCGVNLGYQVEADKTGICILDSPAVISASGTIAVGNTIGPSEDVFTVSTDGSGWVALGAASSSKVLAIRAGGGSGSGVVVFYGTMNEDYTAGPTDMDVTIDRVIGLDEIPSAADVSWNNDHAKLVDIDDEVTGTGYLDDTGKWQVRIIEYDEEFYMCADDAMVVDGGDVDDLYPYGSAPGNAYPYGAD